MLYTESMNNEHATLETLTLERDAWLKQVDTMRGFEQLFDHLPGISIFAKDKDSRIMRGNASLVARFGFKEESEILGMTDYDLFPKVMADKYRKDDLEVIETGKPKLNIIETFFNLQGIPDWFIANKFPVMTANNEVIGVMGMLKSHKAKSFHDGGLTYSRLAPAIEYIQNNFKSTIKVEDLAKVANISLRQFGRLFKEYYAASPQIFIIKTRIQAACEALRSEDIDIANVALDLGFYDQSSFTKHFKKHMGVTPRKFRESI